MKHIVRDEGDACFSFSTSGPSLVFKYTPQRLHCGACHVNVKPKFTEKESSLKIHTLVERRGKTFNDGPRRQNRPCPRMRFKDEVRSVTPTEHGEITFSLRRFCASKN